MNYLIYDCEILKCIPNRDGTRFEVYEYCDGWDDHANMGISVIGCQWSGESRPFACFSVSEFKTVRKQRPGYLVGFNSRRFDDSLMRANGLYVETDYDLLEEVRIAAYGSPEWEDQPQGFSYALGAIGEANGFPKTGSGALAPQLWQQGKHQEVIDYCLNDARITKALLELGLKGNLIDPNTGQKLQLRPLAQPLQEIARK